MRGAGEEASEQREREGGRVGLGLGLGALCVFLGRLFWLLCFDDGGVERAREGEEMTRASQEINHSFVF